MNILKADEALLRGHAHAAEEAAWAWSETDVALEALAHLERRIGILTALEEPSANRAACATAPGDPLVEAPRLR